MDTGCYLYFFLVKLVKYFILFCLVDFCTTIIGEINMINNVDEHPIPPIWRIIDPPKNRVSCNSSIRCPHNKNKNST